MKGYGLVTPKTNTGKIVTIFYAAIGIPMTIALYTVAADFTKKATSNLIRWIEIYWLKRQRVDHATRKSLFTQLLLLVIFVFISSFVSTTKGHGGLSGIDSVYYWFQTLTTIGYGDVIPIMPHNDLTELAKKVIFVFGMGITASLISSIAAIVPQLNSRRLIHAFSQQATWELGQGEHDSSL